MTPPHRFVGSADESIISVGTTDPVVRLRSSRETATTDRIVPIRYGGVMTPPYRGITTMRSAHRVGVPYGGGAIRDDVGIVPYGRVRIDGADSHARNDTIRVRRIIALSVTSFVGATSPKGRGKKVRSIIIIVTK